METSEAEEVPVSAPIEQETPAEFQKKLGNEAFLAKNYEEAIRFYSEAVKLDPDNSVYYSNRSACYALLKRWDEALDEAKLCLLKDPKSVKGFYRKAQAYIELNQLSEADDTIMEGLQIDPTNETILKQRRLIASKRANASRPSAAPVRELDENQRKEVYDLQEQSNAFHRELRTVQAKLSGLDRETKSCAATSRYINTVPVEAPLYRAVGKTFIRTPRSDIANRLANETELNLKAHKDLTDKKEFLDRRITSVQQDMKAIITGV